MSWFVKTFTSSIGMKLLMAVTGLCFCGFLTVHLAGNLTLYAGAETFNSYARHLHSLGPFVLVFELGLLFLGLVHVFTGLTLFYQNLRARPVRYVVTKNAGGRTLGSGTMPYTGLLMLAFVVFHLMNFHFVDKADRTIYQVVHEAFSSSAYVLIYVLAMIVVAVHVSHGFWSAFQTVGADHPKYFPLIRGIGLMFSFLVGAGFGLIPLYISFLGAG